MWVLVVALFLVPALIYLGFQRVGSRVVAPAAAVASPLAAGPVGHSASAGRPLSTAEVLASYAPRIEGLPYTAPRYDEVTKPVTAPFPAACMSMGPVCRCYSQQGTLIQADKSLCLQIVKNGFFQDWAATPAGGAGNGLEHGSAVRPEPPAPVKWSGGNPGASPEVGYVSKGDQVAATSAYDGEVIRRMGRVGGGTRPVLAD